MKTKSETLANFGKRALDIIWKCFASHFDTIYHNLFHLCPILKNKVCHNLSSLPSICP